MPLNLTCLFRLRNDRRYPIFNQDMVFPKGRWHTGVCGVGSNSGRGDLARGDFEDLA